MGTSLPPCLTLNSSSPPSTCSFSVIPSQSRSITSFPLLRTQTLKSSLTSLFPKVNWTVHIQSSARPLLSCPLHIWILTIPGFTSRHHTNYFHCRWVLFYKLKLHHAIPKLLPLLHMPLREKLKLL